MKRLYLHLGTVKTGSTAIQKALWTGRHVLEKFEVSYPEISKTRIDLPRYANADFLFDNARSVQADNLSLHHFAAAKTIISEEGIWGHSSQINSPRFDGFDRTAIIYMRNPADLIASWAGEQARPYNAVVTLAADGGAPPAGPTEIEIGLKRLAKEYRGSFHQLFENLQEFREKGGSVIVRAFERETMVEGSAVADFLSCVGIEPPAFFNEVKEDLTKEVNTGDTRKNSDVSVLVWRLMCERGEANRYSLQLVKRISEACTSGDDRRILETLDDAWIDEICMAFGDFEDRLFDEFQATGTRLTRKLPKVHGTPRKPYQPVDIEEVKLRLEQELGPAKEDKIAKLEREYAKTLSDVPKLKQENETADSNTAHLNRERLTTNREIARLSDEVRTLQATKTRLERDKLHLEYRNMKLRKYPWLQLLPSMWTRIKGDEF